MKIRDSLKRKYNRCIIGICAFMMFLLSTCSNDSPINKEKPDVPKPDPEQIEVIGNVPNTIPSDIAIVKQATKISQLTGDYDKHLNKPTLSQAYSRYRIEGTDLGVPFEDGDITWLLFGDTWGPKSGLHDAIGYTTDKNPEDGLNLDFVIDDMGIYQGVIIPGVSTTGAFEVPTDGLVINDEFFLWITTDHSDKISMGRSVLATANRANALKGQYSKVYDLSISKFINVSVVKIKNSDWDFFPQHEGDGLVLFASGDYRKSQIYLAYQPITEIKNKKSIKYFAGIKDGKPLWNKKEEDAQPIFRLTNPGVGELSASYNKFIKKWILLYNHDDPRGINLRTADAPWGPWSEPRVIFQPWDDKGYCHFIHTSWEFENCDNLHNKGRENEWGGEYGPYQFEHFATGDNQSTTIYFTMSTWNPYDVVLMKSTLRRR